MTFPFCFESINELLAQNNPATRQFEADQRQTAAGDLVQPHDAGGSHLHHLRRRGRG